MHHATDRYLTPLTLAAQEPLRDDAASPRRGECPFLARLSRAAGRLHRRFIGSPDSRRARLQPEPLDDNTLNDIGMPRIEMLFSGPK